MKKTDWMVILVFWILAGTHSISAQVSNGHIPSIPKHMVSVWHWGSATEPMGINFVVNDEEKATKVIESYHFNHITRVYGGYLRIASTPDEREHLRRWNKRLHDHQIASIYLLGSPKWIYPEYREDMLDFITNNFILFNQSVNLPEQLKGIHLDIEIHALPEWKTASDNRKREMMQQLQEAYKAVRYLLNAQGMSSVEVGADIPFWYDSLTAVGWKSEADRKAWFAEVGKYINGFSIMNYENNSIPSILERAKWERDNFKGTVEIGLDSEDIGTTWKTRAEFREALAHIMEKTKAPVAIHRYVVMMKLPGKPLVRED